MNILYIYRIKRIDKKTRNTIKRRFYYNLNKITQNNTTKVFRSTFYINPNKETEIDRFFNEFSEWVDVFKTRIESFEFIIGKHETNIDN